MPTFEQIKKEIADNSYTDELAEKLVEQIRKGEYPSVELNEDKIIELFVLIILEREELIARNHFTTVIDIDRIDFDFYFKILWYVLNKYVDTSERLNYSQQESLKMRLKNAFIAEYNQKLSSEN